MEKRMTFDKPHFKHHRHTHTQVINKLSVLINELFVSIIIIDLAICIKRNNYNKFYVLHFSAMSSEQQHLA